MVTKALILAAGKSSRILPIAGQLPKPLLKIQGQSLLEHNIDLLVQYGIKNIWINLHYQRELIRKEIGNGSRWGISINYSYEKELLGTAGALKNLEKEFSAGLAIVIYGDNFTNCDIGALLKSHKKSGEIATITVFNPKIALNSRIAGGRVLINKNGTIKKFVEGDTLNNMKLSYVNAGIYALEPDIMQYIPKGFSDFGRDIFPKLVNRRLKISTYKMKGYCLAFDTPEAYAQAQKIVGKLM